MHHLVEPLLSRLDEQGMAELYRTIENPLVRVLARMEHAGIAVDVAELRQLNDRLTADVVRLGAELKQVVGRDDLNINSPIQLREILYAAPPAGRGLTPIKKTKTGASTDAATLEKLRDEWPEFIGPLLQYREVEKLRGHVRRGPAGRGRRRRADPRHVQPDRRPHRPAQLGPPEPAQHPGAPGGGPAVPQGVRRRARAASCSSPTTTRSSCAASPTSPPIPG